MEPEERGRKLASDLGWDGLAILEAASEALTDANFHSEAGILAQMAAALKEHDQPDFTLTVKP